MHTIIYYTFRLTLCKDDRIIHVMNDMKFKDEPIYAAAVKAVA